MKLGGRQCLAGSLTGAVTCKKVTQALKGQLSSDGNRAFSVRAQAGLTVRLTSRAETKVGPSDPLVYLSTGQEISNMQISKYTDVLDIGLLIIGNSRPVGESRLVAPEIIG